MDASTFAGRGKSAPQQGQAPAGGSRRSMQPLRPVTIKMLNDAQRVGDGVLVIDGREIGQVSVVGRIVEHEFAAAAGTSTAKYHGYKITDGSGLITVRHWLDSATTEQQISVGSYLRACGTVKIWQESPLITGTVRDLKDNNESTFHYLDCILTHLRITRGTPEGQGAPAGGRPYQAATTSQPAATPLLTGAKPPNIAAAIKRVMQMGNRTHGMSVDEVHHGISQFGYTHQEVQQTLRSLVANGEIFSTDDIHYTW